MERSPTEPGPRPQRPHCPASRVSLFDRSLLITTEGLSSGPIRRPAVTVLVARNGVPFELSVGAGPFERHRAAIVRDNELRSVRAVGCQLASWNLEPGHPLFLRARASVADGAGCRGAREAVVAGLLGDIRQRLLAAEPVELPAALLDELSGAGRAQGPSCSPEFLQRIDAALPEAPSLEVLARSLRLSQSHLSHVFVREVGVPLKTYRAWRRYRHAFRRLSGGDSLSALAFEAGFADAAHMTRAFVGYFGFSPGRVRSSCRIEDVGRPA